MSLDLYLTHDDEYVFERNITHNLTKMANFVGLYEPLWNSKEAGILVAKQAIEPVRAGLNNLIDKYMEAQEFSPANGWGNSEDLLLFALNFYIACCNYPDAKIEVSR